MCLIAFTSTKERLNKDYLRRAHNRNSDAWGIMYPMAGKVQMSRGTGLHGEFDAALRQVPTGAPVATHFRFTTVGSKSLDMAHPFDVLGDGSLAVMHNGTFDQFSDWHSETSDTAMFCEEILKPQLSEMPYLLDNDAWRVALGKMLGGDNKLAFMRGDGKTFLVNQGLGFWENGVWYSNEYSVEEPKPLAPKIDMGKYTVANWLYEDNGRDLLTRDYKSTFEQEYTCARARAFNGVKVEDLYSMTDQEIFSWVSETEPEDVADMIMDLLT